MQGRHMNFLGRPAAPSHPSGSLPLAMRHDPRTPVLPSVFLITPGEGSEEGAGSGLGLHLRPGLPGFKTLSLVRPKGLYKLTNLPVDFSFLQNFQFVTSFSPSLPGVE